MLLPSQNERVFEFQSVSSWISMFPNLQNQNRNLTLSEKRLSISAATQFNTFQRAQEKNLPPASR